MDGKEKKWSIEIGFYPGVLFGIRTYDMVDARTHVLYIPLIDIAFTIEK